MKYGAWQPDCVKRLAGALGSQDWKNKDVPLDKDLNGTCSRLARGLGKERSRKGAKVPAKKEEVFIRGLSSSENIDGGW